MGRCLPTNMRKDIPVTGITEAVRSLRGRTDCNRQVVQAVRCGISNFQLLDSGNLAVFMTVL
jgi:hypothetical protein